MGGRWITLWTTVKEAAVGHVTIHNLDDATLEALRTRADRHGRSLEDEVRDIVVQSVRPPLSREERLVVSRRLRAMTRSGPHPLSEDLIREDRDSR